MKSTMVGYKSSNHIYNQFINPTRRKLNTFSMITMDSIQTLIIFKNLMNIQIINLCFGLPYLEIYRSGEIIQLKENHDIKTLSTDIPLTI